MRFSRWITSRWNAYHAPSDAPRGEQVLTVASLGDVTYKQVMADREAILDRAERETTGVTPPQMADLARILQEFVDEVDEAKPGA